MNFDKRFYDLVEELRALDSRREAIGSELAPYFGAAGTGDGDVQGAPVKPPKIAGKKGKTPGDLQPLVLKTLGSFTKPKTIDELYAKVLKTRPQTKKSSVGAVLASLASRGKVLRQEDGSFYLPADPAQAEIPAALATQPAAYGAPAAEPEVVKATARASGDVPLED